jgi:uncharacterized protein YraI
MLKRNMTGLFAAFGFSLALSASALATTAFVATDLNLRSGPSTAYPVVSVLPRGSSVEVFGCTDGYAWCDVARRGNRGWVSARYLEFPQRGRRLPVAEPLPHLGVPIITFGFGQYWDDHYYDRPWYHERRRYAPPAYRDRIGRSWTPEDYHHRPPRGTEERFIRGGRVYDPPQLGPGGVRMGQDQPPVDPATSP